MNNLLKSLATAAISIGLFAAPSLADAVSPSQQGNFSGVVIVPASASPSRDQAEAPAFKRGKVVAYRTKAAPGAIIVDTAQNRLFYVLGKNQALMFRVATAKEGFEWRGTHKVSSKVKWPDWRPPAEMRKRRPDLPAFMEGGPDNPLGARAIYIGDTEYRIHGTTQPWSIGRAMSSGCIRMMNEEVIDLYDRVQIGATVVVED